jgi:2-C-methyl-D-erythritol 4-phosphate cytidylyltransferase / 2-C-methyl-D-erythritol 2,4-cyclodiphosphate synthase
VLRCKNMGTDLFRSMASVHDNGMGGVAAVVVAGGRGLRAGGPAPKQFRPLGGQPAIRWSLSAFARHPDVDVVQTVIHPDDVDLFGPASAGMDLLPPVSGGATRQMSVRSGLESLASRKPDFVLVHDAARPFASAALISRAISTARQYAAAAPALALSDTVKSIAADGSVGETLDRSRLRLIQTPQAFRYTALREAHVKAAEAGRHDFPDDASLAEWAGMRVSLFEGEAGNVKLTTPDDLARAEMMAMASLGDVRTGQGVDVHAFGPGDHVMLGGIRIPHAQSLTGHSDADVVLHALVDAILGALSDGDIGAHFPPSDARWRGASSDQFLQFAVARVKARGGVIAHLDVSIVCETPKIGPHRDAMRARIADIAGMTLDRIAVKATTSEGLGFIGRGEGIAAFATATIRLPWSQLNAG